MPLAIPSLHYSPVLFWFQPLHLLQLQNATSSPDGQLHTVSTQANSLTCMGTGEMATCNLQDHQGTSFEDMFVSATNVIVTSSSASFKSSVTEQQSTKFTYQNIFLAPVADLTMHFEHYTSYTPASSVKKPFQAQTTLHGINPHASLAKRC